MSSWCSHTFYHWLKQVFLQSFELYKVLKDKSSTTLVRPKTIHKKLLLTTKTSSKNGLQWILGWKLAKLSRSRAWLFQQLILSCNIRAIITEVSFLQPPPPPPHPKIKLCISLMFTWSILTQAPEHIWCAIEK